MTKKKRYAHPDLNPAPRDVEETIIEEISLDGLSLREASELLLDIYTPVEGKFFTRIYLDERGQGYDGGHTLALCGIRFETEEEVSHRVEQTQYRLDSKAKEDAQAAVREAEINELKRLRRKYPHID